MSIKSANMTVMTKAARKAARHLKRDFGEVENLQVSRKGPADFVSNADLKAEKVIHEELAHARPDYGFLMEESGEVAGSDPAQRRWIVDPLDGTTNFLHGLPHFAVSIALEEKGEVVAGVIYDPIKEEMFTAEKGAGAFLNDRRIRVSSRTNLEDSLFATGVPFMGRPGHELQLAEQRRVMARSAGIRRWGTASLDMAYVAAARIDGFWERNLSAWDIAAGVILIKEAGGIVTEIGGRALRLDGGSLVVGNSKLHHKLNKELYEAKRSKPRQADEV
ncbi:inositol monophosphatase family protein [Rhodovibrionaceae bacterium A322]